MDVNQEMYLYWIQNEERVLDLLGFLPIQIHYVKYNFKSKYSKEFYAWLVSVVLGEI